ncbi:MAG: hypothetical protein AAF449_00760 [Myxococcota bacterium]
MSKTLAQAGWTMETLTALVGADFPKSAPMVPHDFIPTDDWDPTEDNFPVKPTLHCTYEEISRVVPYMMMAQRRVSEMIEAYDAEIERRVAAGETY